MGMLEPITIRALVLQHLTSYTLPVRPGGGVENQFRGLSLADADPFSSESIDIILGADIFGLCLLTGLKQGALGSLTAQDTVFGWILSGPVHERTIERMVSITAQQSITEEVLHDDLRRFWEMEEPTTRSCSTSDELTCELHFLSTDKRLPSGRYMVLLPFRNGPPIDIGNSLTTAKLVLKGVQARLLKDSSFYNEYKEFLTEYEQLGHMERVQEFSDCDTPQTVYLTHHPIVKDSSFTTRVRVVFNASILTSNNTPLNSHLYIGPKILTDLVSIILGWRCHRIIFVADIEKMFRQILVDPHDRNYQRIVCYSTRQRLEIWVLNTVTYGTACAPYIANRVIKQLAIDEGSDFPAAKSVLKIMFMWMMYFLALMKWTRLEN